MSKHFGMADTKFKFTTIIITDRQWWRHDEMPKCVSVKLLKFQIYVSDVFTVDVMTCY